MYGREAKKNLSIDRSYREKIRHENGNLIERGFVIMRHDIRAASGFCLLFVSSSIIVRYNISPFIPIGSFDLRAALINIIVTSPFNVYHTVILLSNFFLSIVNNDIIILLSTSQVDCHVFTKLIATD